MLRNIKFLPPKVVVHLPTFSTYCKFIRVIHGKEGDISGVWENHKKNTCYLIGDNFLHPGAFGSRKFYKERGFSIFTFNEFLAFQGLTKADIPSDA